MPIFTKWCLPLVILFLVTVVSKADKSFVVLSFLLAYSGMFIAFIRSLIQSKNTLRNKPTAKTERYFK